MHALGDADFLGIWEHGRGRHPMDRALLVVAAAFPEESGEVLADWPIGRRNRALARLYGRYFSPRLRAWLACVQCGEKLEFELNANVLAESDAEATVTGGGPVVVNGRTFRLPTSRDLAGAAREENEMKAAARIAESCLVEAKAPSVWSETELSAIGERMAQADPLAEMRLTFHCPSCGRDWEETLDLVSFVWAEIEARARRILFTVHSLASAYGWTEAEILSLGDDRRALYLQLVQS